MDTLDDELQGQPNDDRAPASAINPIQLLLHAVGRYPISIIALTLLGGIVALLVALSQPNTYTSVGMLLVRMGARERQTPESAVNPDFETRGGGSTATGDELMMLMNPALRPRVVEEVGARRLIRPYDPSAADTEATPAHIRWVHQLQAWLMSYQPSAPPGPPDVETPKMIARAVDVVANGTNISAQRNSNTIVVSFTGHDPELAQVVASAYLKVLQRRHREFFETGDSFSFVTERLLAANKQADEARAALIAQREKDGIYNLKARQDDLADEIRALEAQNDGSAVEMQSLSTKLLGIQAQLETTPATIPLDGEETATATSDAEGKQAPAEGESQQDTKPTTNDDPELVLDTLPNLRARHQALRSEIAVLKRTFVETSSQYENEAGPILRELQSIEAQIKTLNERAATNEPGSHKQQQELPPPGRRTNPVYTTLKTKQLDYAREKEALVAEIQAREGILRAKIQELTRLASLEPVYTRLLRDLADKERRAAELEKAHTQSETLQLIDSDERMANLQVTQEPFLPTQKQGPDRLKIILAGIFGGLALGLALALARQIIDPKLRYPGEAESSLGVRVLGVVPEQSSWRRTGKKLQDTMVRRT